LAGFPHEFISGMKTRRDILGDDGPSDPEWWDPIWRHKIHMCVCINGQAAHARDLSAIEERYAWLTGLVARSDGGVVQLTGHRGPDGADDLPYQDGSALYGSDDRPLPKEHFGYTDGIGDAVFEGQTGSDAADRVAGGGKLLRQGGWARLATGEFLLGHPDEAEEYPAAPVPRLLSRNGTFMAYRKLHQNVGSFNRLLDRLSAQYPGGRELLAAKWSGRWRDNGAPLVKAPDLESKAKFDAELAEIEARIDRDPQDGEARAARLRMLLDFDYNNDLEGYKCPASAHIRRINPRGYLEFGKKSFATPGALDDRRRIMRRGLPYGRAEDPDSDDDDHGIIFMALCASIERQFEFVQQQWINYANDFKLGNEKDVLLGNHDPKCPIPAVIQRDPASGKPPFFVTDIPRLVTTRGGEYFFIPSLTALRMIAAGIVDPT
jgi:Dyp-type peroxidase family